VLSLYESKEDAMAKESERNDSEKTISDRLKINKENDQTAIHDLTSNDGSEDPGAELDTEFRAPLKNTKSDLGNANDSISNPSGSLSGSKLGMKLDTRLSAGPVYGKTHLIGEEQIDPWPPEVGNVINLKCEGQYILVRILNVNGQTYTGQIMGFENNEPSLGDKELGDMIEFNYEHIFVISR